LASSPFDGLAVLLHRFQNLVVDLQPVSLGSRVPTAGEDFSQLVLRLLLQLTEKSVYGR